MDDLLRFLRAQVDDDEREIAKHPDGYDDVDGYFAAERALANRKQHRDDIASAGALLALLGAVKDLAQPYAGREGWRDEWNEQQNDNNR